MTDRLQTQHTTRTAAVGEIPDKMYFRIGEVAQIIGVKPYVLRYWETEFPALRPHKSRTRQRMYRRREVEMLLKIRHLLYDRKYTIAGARQLLKIGHLSEVVVDENPSGSPSTPPRLVKEGVASPRALDERRADGTVSTPPAAAHVDGAVTMARAGKPEPRTGDAGATGQLPLNLKVSAAVRDDIRRGLEDILRLCDHAEEAETDPMALVRPETSPDRLGGVSSEVTESG
jgi:DNA-binding transcriptional MerR regulator